MTRSPFSTFVGPAPWWRRAGALLSAVLTTLTALTILALWAAPAGAHDGVILTVHGDGRGSVWMTATWEDGHPVSGPIGAVLSATSTAGQRVGPAALRPNGPALTYAGTLPPGEWTVVAEMGQPAIGRCEAVLRVVEATASPLPTEIRCAPSPVATAPPVTPPTRSGSSVGYWLAGATIAVLAVGLVLYAGQRTRQGTRQPARQGTRQGTRQGARSAATARSRTKPGAKARRDR